MDKKLEEMAQLTEKIYNLSFVLKEYCKVNPDDIEEIRILYSLVESMYNNIDILNCFFINMIFSENSVTEFS